MYSNKKVEDLRVENLENIYVNGIACTVAKVFVKHFDRFDRESWVYSDTVTIKGTVKKENTFLKRITK